MERGLLWLAVRTTRRQAIARMVATAFSGPAALAVGQRPAFAAPLACCSGTLCTSSCECTACACGNGSCELLCEPDTATHITQNCWGSSSCPGLTCCDCKCYQPPTIYCVCAC
jgi:hypothetical protein